MPVRRRFPWTRRFIRRYFPQVTEEVAYRWEQRLSVAYFFLGWNALLAIGYLWYRERQQRDITGDERADKINRVKRLMSASQSETIRVLEYKGFTRVNDETLHVTHERPSAAARPGTGVTVDTAPEKPEAAPEVPEKPEKSVDV